MLIKCPECELQVSDKAICCPHCGYPLKQNINQPRQRKSNRRKRLPNGFGQISEIKGKNLRNPYRAMVTVGKTDKGKPICKPLKPKSYFPTYNDAYAALVEYNRNPYDLQSDITLEELYERWSSEYFKTLKSYKHIETAWKYCSEIHSMRVVDVRARHIKACIENGTIIVRGKEQHPQGEAKLNIKFLFDMMLDYAYEYEIVTQNYAKTFSLPNESLKNTLNPKSNHIPFTDEEMTLLWKNLGKIPGIDIVIIQCYSGWRPKELELLKISDVDLEKGTMKGGVKSNAGTDRIVPIHSKIKNLVKDRYDEALNMGSDRLFNYSTKGKLSEANHTFLTYNRYAKLFREICEKLNLNPDHRPHDGRKHFVTMAKKYNVDEYAIKYIVGHSITDITEKIYTQRDVSWLKAEIEKIK